jgi:hypothetical protein
VATDHDQLFKQLLRIFTFEFILLFLKGVATYIDPASITFIETEVFTDLVTGERYRADVVIKARFKASAGVGAAGACFIIHVEPQGKDRQGFPRRMFQYFSPLHLGHDLPVYPVALLTYDSPLREAPSEYRVEFPDLTPLVYTYRVIQLNRLNWRDFLSHHNPVAVALMTKMRIEKRDRPRVKLECLRLMLTLKLDPARMTLIRGFLDAYLQLNSEELVVYNREVQSIEPEEREAVMQLVNEWEAIGEARGLDEGKRLGRLEIVLDLLESRLGSLPTEVHERVSALGLPQLKSLTRAAAGLGDVDALRAWLDGQIG